MADMMRDYVDVAERISIFRQKYPEGSLQPLNLEKPYEIVTVGDKTFIVYAAAAYRSPDDIRPGIGMAWEPFPGRTSFQRDSELMVCETSAWGRAIVAVLAADTKRGVASAEEVRNRQTTEPTPPVAKTKAPTKKPAPTPNEGGAVSDATVQQLVELAKKADIHNKEEIRDYCSIILGREVAGATDMSASEIAQVIVALKELIAVQG